MKYAEAFQTVAATDAPGLVRALVGLIDAGGLQVSSQNCSDEELLRAMNALHDILDQREETSGLHPESQGVLRH